MDLIFATRRLEGALTGAPAVGDATLRFSALTGVAAMIETVPLEEAPAAYAKMMVLIVYSDSSHGAQSQHTELFLGHTRLFLNGGD